MATDTYQAEVKVKQLKFVDDRWRFAFTCADTELFDRIVDAVKALPLIDRRWAPGLKCWLITDEGMRRLAATNPILSTLMDNAKREQAEAEAQRRAERAREQAEAFERAERERRQRAEQDRRWREQFRASSGGYGYSSQSSSGSSLPANVAQAYTTLYLLPGAPLSVIKAAYKALALEHHPDHGGSADKMKAINVAFELIEKSKRASA